jgi:hypothetical protein
MVRGQQQVAHLVGVQTKLRGEGGQRVQPASQRRGAKSRTRGQGTWGRGLAVQDGYTLAIGKLDFIL